MRLSCHDILSTFRYTDCGPSAYAKSDLLDQHLWHYSFDRLKGERFDRSTRWTAKTDEAVFHFFGLTRGV